MSTSEKINQRLNSISDTVLNFVQSLTNLCESEIEKLFFNNLIFYLFYHEYKDWSGYDTLDSYHGRYQGLRKIVSTKYDELNIPFHITKGITFADSISFTDLPNNTICYEYIYEIIPQYCIEIDPENYRIDFAIICKKYENRVWSKQ
jgi:hypothetical protein